MSDLFARFYLDEDVAVLLATLLKSRGFEALTTQEAGHVGTSDAHQLEFATSGGFALLTHNRADFESLVDTYFAAGKHHGGIVIAVRRQPHDLLRRVLKLLNRNSADEIKDNVWYV